MNSDLESLQGRRGALPNAVEAGRDDAPCYFLHIPKTGGTSLIGYVHSFLPDALRWHKEKSPTWDALLSSNEDELRCCHFINGHFGGSVFIVCPFPLRYFTILRDPISRAISHYEHVIRDETHYFHHLAKELGSFGAYLRDERTQPTIANFQLRCVGATLDSIGIWKTLSQAEIAQHELERRLDTMSLSVSEDQLLQVAKARLEQMCAVGITERFDDSLALLSELFQWPRIASIGRLNVNPRPVSDKDLKLADRRFLRRLNSADIELYELARARFAHDWQRSRFTRPHVSAFVSYAQNAEDVLLHRALRDVEKGTYVDAGAQHPTGDSITKAFYDRGWRGINIEPVPELFGALSKERPQDINVQAAAGSEDGEATIYRIPGTGLSTLDKSIADRHRAQGFKVEESLVTIRPIRSILDDAELQVLHFLKIDVEGFERQALEGMDFKRHRPWIVLVEATEPNTTIPSHHSWEPLLLREEYQFVLFDGLNRFYVANEHRELTDLLATPVNSGDTYIRASEAQAFSAVRSLQWRVREFEARLSSQIGILSEANERLRAAESAITTREDECEALRAEVCAQATARQIEFNEAARQTKELTERATAATQYAESVATERDKLRKELGSSNEVRDHERLDAAREIDALAIELATERTRVEGILDDKLKHSRRVESLVAELMTAKAEAACLTGERSALIQRHNELANQLVIAKASSESVGKEIITLRMSLDDLKAARTAERSAAARLNQEATERLRTVESARTVAEFNLARLTEHREREIVEDASKTAKLTERIETLQLKLNESQSCIRELTDKLQRRIALASHRRRYFIELRRLATAKLKDLADRLQLSEKRVHGLNVQLATAKESLSEARAKWRRERQQLQEAIQTRKIATADSWKRNTIKLLRGKRAEPALNVSNLRVTRRIGVFTIASKNYLPYVRVLLKSVAALHPEYSLYFCLADKIEGMFDPSKEIFEIVESDGIGIPNFHDMCVRYDIMEFNTAVKPFMFRWLLDNTDLDSVIYLDPDIRAYSRFDKLEELLSSDTSVVLTPHITMPVEDRRNPSDYHMLQSGVFNLGFAAVNRTTEAREYVEWWGRRLASHADCDFSRNLFTDQRWCDLAPCFLDQLQILKTPGYNVAYWNLAHRAVYKERSEWRVNRNPLVFFHFSGVNAGNEDVVSKHQNRFTWADIPDCKPLFDAYREELLREGWEQCRTWHYAYDDTVEGLRIAPVVRRLYKASYPEPQNFPRTTVTAKLLELCNGPSAMLTQCGSGTVTNLMYMIYSSRPDLQAAFSLKDPGGVDSFRAWYASKGLHEYGLSSELLPQSATRVASVTSAHDAPAPDQSAYPIANAWDALPLRAKRLLLRISKQLDVLHDRQVQVTSSAEFNEPIPPIHTCGARIDSLTAPAPLPQKLENGRYISVLMHMIWASRPDLRAAFDVTKVEGQASFLTWFDASAHREYGLKDRESVEQGASVAKTQGSPSSRDSFGHPGANLVGYAHAELGMGEHVRMSAAALDGTDVNYAVLNFNLGVASRQRASLDHGQLTRQNSYSTNIFHINADQMLTAYCRLGRNFFINRYNVGYWAWELSRCPIEWLPVIKMIDEIWAPSRFIQNAFAQIADVPVQYMPLCVTLPPVRRLERAQLGLPRDAFVFLYTFDFYSFLDRKNPLAAIRAFKTAFPRSTNKACLVLKVMNGDERAPTWKQMLELINGDPRIVIINRTLDRSDVLSLFEMSDCFISLHRSEGFGRGPAEAMYLGKPVIATNYSGNTDFTLPGNSCLVDFTLIPVGEGQYPFHHNQEWADADVEHAAWYMKRLFDDQRYGREIGARGRAFIHENFSQRAIGSRYEARLRELKLV